MRAGLPEYEILKATEASNAGLIVIGRKTRGVLNGWVSSLVWRRLHRKGCLRPQNWLDFTLSEEDRVVGRTLDPKRGAARS